MLRSDYWDFPTNLLSNLSWLGRVHRGTPWQTLYLKSAVPRPYHLEGVDRQLRSL